MRSPTRFLQRGFLIWSAAIGMVLAVALLAAPAGAASAMVSRVYDNSPPGGDWSWAAAINPEANPPVNQSNRPMAVAYQRGWAGVRFHHPGFDTSPYSHLRFALHPNSRAFPDLEIALYGADGELIHRVPVAPYLDTGASGWSLVTIPLADLNVAGMRVTGVHIQDASGNPWSPFHIDHFGFVTPDGDQLPFHKEFSMFMDTGRFWGGGARGGASSDQAPEADAEDAGDDGAASSSEEAPSSELVDRVYPLAPSMASRDWGPGSGSVANYKRPDGGFRPVEASQDVDAAIRDAVAKYNLPRWFYYAIAQRESSFDPEAIDITNSDYGLMQLAGDWYTGQPYPEGLAEPDDNYLQYAWDMNFREFGLWVKMSEVSSMDDPFDAEQNLNRFSTGYAVPAFYLFKHLYGLGDTETLRALAFHWNKGVHVPYDPANEDYLMLYDKYVHQFKGQVEWEDGRWDGKPHLP